MESTKEKVYLTAYPHLLAEWHPTKNGNLDPTKITYGSNKKVWWVCRAGHEWGSKVYSRAQSGNGCPHCSGRRPIPGETDLASQRPDLAAEWSPNNDRGPGNVSVGSEYRAVWVCTEHSHEWVARVNHRTSGTGCPVCAGRCTLAGFNDLATTHPDLAKEWGPNNGDLTPEMVSAGTGKKVWWVCVGGHGWAATPHNRSRSDSGCPKCCTSRTSKIEGELCRLLSEHFTGAEQDVRIGRWSIDILLPEEKVVVEYDGAYFHTDRIDQDTRKTLDLLKSGYRIVRVREQSKRYTLPSIDIQNPNYLELTYDYSPDWSGLSDVVDQITDWITDLTD